MNANEDTGFIRVDSCALDRKSTRLNSSHSQISYAVFCLKKKIANSSFRSVECPCYNSSPRLLPCTAPYGLLIDTDLLTPFCGSATLGAPAAISATSHWPP